MFGTMHAAESTNLLIRGCDTKAEIVPQLPATDDLETAFEDTMNAAEDAGVAENDETRDDDFKKLTNDVTKINTTVSSSINLPSLG